MTDSDELPLSLVLFSGTEDKLQAAAVLTAGAAALGRPVHIFLQYWALEAFRTGHIDDRRPLSPEAGDFGQPHTDGACDHEGQCVLLAVWADVGEHMRRYLEAATLADIVTMARGDAAWPGDEGSAPTVTPPWAGAR